MQATDPKCQKLISKLLRFRFESFERENKSCDICIKVNNVNSANRVTYCTGFFSAIVSHAPEETHQENVLVPKILQTHR